MYSVLYPEKDLGKWGVCITVLCLCMLNVGRGKVNGNGAGGRGGDVCLGLHCCNLEK